MKLIITRHGETVENQQRIIQGHLPGKLSEKGIKQAKKVAERLKDEHIGYIYSSDLARASDTAKEISKFHSNIPIKFVKELRERNLGEFQGRSADEIDWDKDVEKFRNPEEGETHEEIYNRAKRFLFEVLGKHKDDTVLFVGHDGIDKALIAVITGKKATEINTIENLGNTSISIFEIDEDKNHKIHLFNCTKHLD